MTTTTKARPRTKTTPTKAAPKAAPAKKPSTAAKKAAPKPVAVKPVTKAAAPTAPAKSASNAPAPAVSGAMQPVVASRQMRHKELADRVAARTGLKKKDVKPVIQATLAVMGEVLGEQRGMVLPPLGRVKLQRAKEVADGRVLVLKLRQKFDQQTAATPKKD